MLFSFSFNRYSVLNIFFVILLFSCSKETPLYPDPLDVEESLKLFDLDDRFEIKAYVNEPSITSPVDLVFDEWGDAYVVELLDYPYKDSLGTSRIKKLIDHEGDGRVDETHLFAEGLMDATSALPWKGGLIVTSAPYILYLRDTDGDHRSDQVDTLFSGFFNNNSEAQITNLRYGLDNWIYANNNGHEGEVRYHGHPGEPPLQVKGGDFRFRLDRHEYQAETGSGQFGQVLNDRNHRFVTTNSVHIQQVVVPRRYLTRHPYLRSLRSNEDISDHSQVMHQVTPAPYWREERTRRRQARFDEHGLNRTEHPSGHFSGASGGTFYGSDVFPKEFYGNVFTGDVSGNLLHRDVLASIPNSPRYEARRAKGEENREFLSSRDMWFRPVGTTVGPDGYLYVIDMYRQHIEMPPFIPDDLKEMMDFHNGKEYGRIYQVRPKGHQRRATGIKLGELSPEDLVHYLSHGDQWWRIQAQRLLIERNDAAVIPLVRSLLSHEKAPARLHALYVLEGLNALTREDVLSKLNDTDGAIREHALILAERFPNLLPVIASMVADPDPHVSFQAALSLGMFDDKLVTKGLCEVLENYGADNWFRLAVLSSAVGSSVKMFSELLKRGKYFKEENSAETAYLEELAFAIGSRNNEREFLLFLDLLNKEMLLKQNLQLAGLNGLEKGIKAHLNKGGKLNGRQLLALKRFKVNKNEE